MKSSQELKKQLRQIDHKGYKAYKVLEGEYDFGAYRLCIDHVQGDPFATPSRVRIVYKNEIPVKFFDRPYRRTATEDALLRRLHGNLFRVSKGGGRRGSGKSGLITACRTRSGGAAALGYAGHAKGDRGADRGRISCIWPHDRGAGAGRAAL